MFDILEPTELPPTSHAADPAAVAPPEPGPLHPNTLHPADAGDELLAVLGRIDQLEAQAATALAQLNDAAKWRRKGYTSATAFLKHRAAMSAGRAMGLVIRANALENMPHTSAAFARGELSVEQVDILCGAYNFNQDQFGIDETTLVGLAIQLPFVDEVYRLIAYWKQRIDPVATELDQDMLNSLRGIRIRRDNGVGRAYVCLNEEEFDAWINSLDPGPPAPQDRRTLAQRRADRLVEQAAATMDQPQLVVNVGLDNLAGTNTNHAKAGTAAQLAETEYGSVLAPGAVERLACDATVCRVVFGPDSQILDVGRQRRLFTAPMRLAVSARDRHCRFPGCDRPPQWCDVHHIKHWARGGKTSVDNGILLCRFHHTLVHEAGWNIRGTPRELIVHDDLGRVHATSSLTPVSARAP